MSFCLTPVKFHVNSFNNFSVKVEQTLILTNFHIYNIISISRKYDGLVRLYIFIEIAFNSNYCNYHHNSEFRTIQKFCTLNKQ